MKKWVENNRDNLNASDVNATFKYVRSNHPYYGCATWSLYRGTPTLSKEMSIKELSNFADAVTVCCFEVLGNRNYSNIKIDQLNETAIGNTAYISMNHFNKNIREIFEDFIEK